nr:reverse transcriptase domain-containing protein [Tanacetum cinerariifolium]
MCDASDYAVGAVLGQRKDKYFRPIHYASKTLSNAQTNYTVTEKELLAVVYAFEKFRSYLVLSKTIEAMDILQACHNGPTGGHHGPNYTSKKLLTLAYENSLIYKEKTKKIHDAKIKNREFHIGDRVLLFNSRLKIFSSKLKSRWTGPFTVAQVFPYGTIELSQADGPNFKSLRVYGVSRVNHEITYALKSLKVYGVTIPLVDWKCKAKNGQDQMRAEQTIIEWLGLEVGERLLSKFEADFKQQQSKMTNKIDIVLKAITDRIIGALPSDTVKNPKLSTSPVLSARSYPTIDPQCSSHPSTSINAIKVHSKEANISQTSLLRPKMKIKTQQPEEPKPTLEDEFQDLHLNITVLEVLAHALIYNAMLDKYVESLKLGKNRSAFVQGEVCANMEDRMLFTLPCRLGDLKPFDTLADLRSCVNIILLYLLKKLNNRLLEETDHIFGYEEGPKTPLLVGRGFLSTANAVIDCRMAKIAVGEGITRSVFKVKGVDLGEDEAPYWTTLGKREPYEPRPRSDGVGAKPLIMLGRTSDIVIYPENGKLLEMPSLILLRIP